MTNYIASVSRLIGALSSNAESRAAKKIHSFEHVKNGWNFGEGIAPDDSTIAEALTIEGLGYTLNIERDAFLGDSGEILVSFYCKDEHLGVTINPDLTKELFLEKGIGFSFDELLRIDEASIETIKEQLACLAQRGLNTLGSLNMKDMTIDSSESQVWHSETTKAGYRFCAKTASKTETYPRFVSTSGLSTPMLIASL
jgi:hypothetical protein